MTMGGGKEMACKAALDGGCVISLSGDVDLP